MSFVTIDQFGEVIDPVTNYFDEKKTRELISSQLKARLEFTIQEKTIPGGDLKFMVVITSITDFHTKAKGDFLFGLEKCSTAGLYEILDYTTKQLTGYSCTFSLENKTGPTNVQIKTMWILDEYQKLMKQFLLDNKLKLKAPTLEDSDLRDSKVNLLHKAKDFTTKVIKENAKFGLKTKCLWYKGKDETKEAKMITKFIKSEQEFVLDANGNKIKDKNGKYVTREIPIEYKELIEKPFTALPTVHLKGFFFGALAKAFQSVLFDTLVYPSEGYGNRFRKAHVPETDDEPEHKEGNSHDIEL